jgi:hypothetical protein
VDQGGGGRLPEHDRLADGLLDLRPVGDPSNAATRAGLDLDRRHATA